VAHERLEIHPNAVYTLAEACEILQVSPATLGRWIKDGKVHTARVGRGHRFLGSQLLGVLEGSTALVATDVPPHPPGRPR